MTTCEVLYYSLKVKDLTLSLYIKLIVICQKTGKSYGNTWGAGAGRGGGGSKQMLKFIYNETLSTM